MESMTGGGGTAVLGLHDGLMAASPVITVLLPAGGCFQFGPCSLSWPWASLQALNFISTAPTPAIVADTMAPAGATARPIKEPVVTI